MKKSSLNPSEPNIFYKSIIKNTLLFFITLLILSITTVIYLTIKDHSEGLLRKIGRIEKYAEHEIEISKIRYINQIKCYKKILRKYDSDLKELKPLLEICNSLVTNKIILDKNRKVIFSDIATDINLDRYSDQDLGFSFSELKNIDKNLLLAT